MISCMPESIVNQLFEAIRTGDIASVSQLLLEHPEYVNVQEAPKHDSPQPIHAAAETGQLEIVKLLVASGATVYSHPFCSYPAVIRAAWAKQSHVVDYFLSEIPHLAEGTGGIGVTCNLAGRQGWKDQVQRHIERDPLAVDQRGWIGDTPLHWPAHNGYIEIVQMLLDAGADPNIEENNWIGGTPVHWASERHAVILQMLADKGGDMNARVTRPGSHHLGATPLIWCAKQEDDSVEAACMLLDLGADPSLTDAIGKTALDYARPGIAVLLSQRMS